MRKIIEKINARHMFVFMGIAILVITVFWGFEKDENKRLRNQLEQLQQTTEYERPYYYDATDGNGYNTFLGNTFYVIYEDYTIPAGNTGLEFPSDHPSGWAMSVICDGGTRTEYLVFYMVDHPEYGICAVERRKYEEER